MRPWFVYTVARDLDLFILISYDQLKARDSVTKVFPNFRYFGRTWCLWCELFNDLCYFRYLPNRRKLPLPSLSVGFRRLPLRAVSARAGHS